MRVGIAIVAVLFAASASAQASRPAVEKYLKDAVMSCNMTAGAYDAAKRGLVPAAQAEKLLSEQDGRFKGSFLAAIDEAGKSDGIVNAVKMVRTREQDCIQSTKVRMAENSGAAASRVTQAQAALELAVAAVRTEIDLTER